MKTTDRSPYRKASVPTRIGAFLMPVFQGDNDMTTLQESSVQETGPKQHRRKPLPPKTLIFIFLILLRRKGY